MKRIFAIFLLPLLLLSCSKDSTTNPTDNNTGYQFSCVINGGTFSNKTYSFDVDGGSIYVPGSDETACSFTDPQGNSAQVIFKGNKTGTFNANEEENAVMIHLISTTELFYLKQGENIKVTTYGSVGGNVEGTFSGKAIYVNASTGAQFEVTFSNGKFKAKRIV